MKNRNTLALLCALIAAIPFAAADEKTDKKKADVVKKTWVIADPAAKFADDKLVMKAEISKDDGTVTLANRAMITTKDEFKTGCTVKLTWQWTEGDEKYPDHLAIVLRSSGKQDLWPHEITEGLTVKFNPAGKGIVTIHETKSDQPAQELARNKDGVTLDQNTNYEIEVVDSGDKISVKVGGKLAVEAKVDKGSGKVSVYNREPVANVRHVSLVSDLSVEALKLKK